MNPSRSKFINVPTTKYTKIALFYRRPEREARDNNSLFEYGNNSPLWTGYTALGGYTGAPSTVHFNFKQPLHKSQCWLINSTSTATQFAR